MKNTFITLIVIMFLLIYLVCVCHKMSVDRMGSLLQAHGSQGSNSGHEAHWKMLLHSKPSYQFLVDLQPILTYT